MKNYTITVNGKVYEVTMEENTQNGVKKETAAPAPSANPAPVRTVNTGASVGGTPVKAPMPGKILDVKVSQGQNVKRGDVLMVLEAMKMENEIVAPEDGTVASVQVSSGSVVETGDVLASLKQS